MLQVLPLWGRLECWLIIPNLRNSTIYPPLLVALYGVQINQHAESSMQAWRMALTQGPDVL